MFSFTFNLIPSYTLKMNVGHKFVSAARVMAILLKISRIYSLFDNQSYNSLSTVSCLLETFPGIISITNDIRDGIRIISVSDREQVVTLNVAILLLTLIHGYRPVTVAAFAGTFALLVASLTTPTLLSKGAVMKLRVFASLAAACSKGPQIYLNWKRGRVGWLNGASVRNVECHQGTHG